jgi:hypothetical protein
MKSQGFFQIPQDIMEEYNGCSVPQYTRYRRDRRLTRGHLKGIAGSIVIPLGHTELGMVEVDTGSRFIL